MFVWIVHLSALSLHVETGLCLYSGMKSENINFHFSLIFYGLVYH